jgi:hypothetical protein
MARWRGHTPHSGLDLRDAAAGHQGLRSASMPTPSPESEQAIVRTRAVGRFHLRCSDAFAALRASVARALPTERKWSKPAADSHAAPSTKTPE